MRIPRTFPLWLGLLCSPGLASAQAPATGGRSSPALPGASASGASEPGGAKPILDLSHRYRFSEAYATRGGKPAPGAIDAYRVSDHVSIKESGEAFEGVAGTEVVRDVEYVERPSEVSGLGSIISTARTYNRFASRPDEPTQAAGGRLLEGLTVWFRPRRGEPPLMLSLDGRRLREREYELASRQVFFPALAGLLPTQSIRIGDTWPIPRKAVQALLAEPEVRGDALRGKFVELRQAPDSPSALRAVFAITGAIQTQTAETLINAELVFDFARPRPDAAEPARKVGPARGDDALIEARGAITGLRMARVAQGVMSAGAAPKPRSFRVDQELVLERRLGGPGPTTRGDLATSTPAATVDNSWLTYDDPQGRFSFRHPQDLLPPPQGQASINALFLTRGSLDGRERDLLQIDVFPEHREPQALKDYLRARWDQTKAEVLSGGEEWLPPAEWAGVRAYRIEAALKSPGRGPLAPRVHFDAYLLQFSDQASVFAVATTSKDSVPAFRREIEQVLKTFRPTGPK